MKARLMVMLIAAICLIAPPQANAECAYYWDATPVYFQECLCWACQYSQGSTCTQCYNINTGDSCTTKFAYCKPGVQNPM